MYKKFVTLLLIAAVANAQLIGWRNCGSNLATIHRIRVQGCNQTPCQFNRGDDVHIELDATALANSNNLPFTMTASVFGVPFPLLQGNACDHFLVGSCPALTGQSFTFHIVYRITELLPAPLNTVITSTLWNDFGDVGVCIEVDGIVLA